MPDSLHERCCHVNQKQHDRLPTASVDGCSHLSRAEPLWLRLCGCPGLLRSFRQVLTPALTTAAGGRQRMMPSSPWRPLSLRPERKPPDHSTDCRAGQGNPRPRQRGTGFLCFRSGTIDSSQWGFQDRMCSSRVVEAATGPCRVLETLNIVGWKIFDNSSIR